MDEEPETPKVCNLIVKEEEKDLYFEKELGCDKNRH